jgi:quercetin dioxygenase-like cupin family protein
MLNFRPEHFISKETLFQEGARQLSTLGFQITEIDSHRPWGGYIRVAEDDAGKFIQTFFESKFESQNLPQTPKLLFVAPHQRLSWQYHKLRQELWRILSGPVEVITSKTDTPGLAKVYNAGDIIHLDAEERHRIVGLENWGIWVEIWQHISTEHPSTEHEDIYRIADDYGR